MQKKKRVWQKRRPRGKRRKTKKRFKEEEKAKKAKEAAEKGEAAANAEAQRAQEDAEKAEVAKAEAAAKAAEQAAKVEEQRAKEEAQKAELLAAKKAAPAPGPAAVAQQSAAPPSEEQQRPISPEVAQPMKQVASPQAEKPSREKQVARPQAEKPRAAAQAQPASPSQGSWKQNESPKLSSPGSGDQDSTQKMRPQPTENFPGSAGSSMAKEPRRASPKDRDMAGGQASDGDDEDPGSATEGGPLSPSATVGSQNAPERKSYAGTYSVDDQGKTHFVKSFNTRIEDLSPEEQADIMRDIQETRKKKIEELIKRQKKHAAKRKKDQKKESKKLGKSGDASISDDERKQKVRELKKWLKKKEMQEAEKNRELSPMEILEQKASKSSLNLEGLEQDHLEMRERRNDIAEGKRQFMASRMAQTVPPSRVLHRHVHHHVHYHDGAEDADGNQMGGMRQSASAASLPATAPAMGMPWRPLVHSASAGGVGQGDPHGFDRPAPANYGAYPAQNPQGVPVPPGGQGAMGGRVR